MKIRVHFDYEDIEVMRGQLIEYLDDTGDFDDETLQTLTDEVLCAAINDYDVTDFYDNWLGEKSADAIRMEIAHD